MRMGRDGVAALFIVVVGPSRPDGMPLSKSQKGIASRVGVRTLGKVRKTGTLAEYEVRIAQDPCDRSTHPILRCLIFASQNQGGPGADITDDEVFCSRIHSKASIHLIASLHGSLLCCELRNQITPLSPTLQDFVDDRH